MGKKQSQIESLQETLSSVERQRDSMVQESRRLDAALRSQDAECMRLQRSRAVVSRERDDARAQRNVLQARLDAAAQALNPKPLAPGNHVGKVGDVKQTPEGIEVTFRVNSDPLITALKYGALPLSRPAETFVNSTEIHVGQVRKNKDYSTRILVIAPPRQTSYGSDKLWLVKYLSTNRTERRGEAFIRYYYPNLLLQTGGTVRHPSPPDTRPRHGSRNPFVYGTPNYWRWDREFHSRRSSPVPF